MYILLFRLDLSVVTEATTHADVSSGLVTEATTHADVTTELEAPTTVMTTSSVNDNDMIQSSLSPGKQ